MAGSVAEQRYQAYKDQGFQAFFYVSETPQGKPPDAAYCKTVRAKYGLTMPVLYGSASALGAIGISLPSNDYNIVLDKGGKILYYKKGGNQSAITNLIEGQL